MSSGTPMNSEDRYWRTLIAIEGFKVTVWTIVQIISVIVYFL
ncbi:hypothetical protein OG440_33865 [Streptomyces sp. NBC_00637]